MARPKVVICGSFRKNPTELSRLFRELETSGCRVLSPLTLDFTDTSEAFVTSQNDETFSVRELERFHLRALREADFVVLHAPEGHVGISASYELGYAAALNIPVYSRDLPQDPMLATQVTPITSIFEILDM